MGFCTAERHQRFLRQCPVFERLLVEDGIILAKYWFSVSDAEQERRFRQRLNDPTRLWKLSEIDLASRSRFVDFSRAKDRMFVHTDTDYAPWWVVEADLKRNARLNCISHLLSLIPYVVTKHPPLKLPKRQPEQAYARPDPQLYRFVPDHAGDLLSVLRKEPPA